MKILITGTAGFIGYHLANALAARGDEVIGLDAINDYYDVGLKMGRLDDAGFDHRQVEYKQMVDSRRYPNHRFVQLNLEDTDSLHRLFREHRFDAVCHLAAQAGVRYSIQNPAAYVQSNIVGFANVLECCRQYGVKHLAYASSSSVYGLNKKVPFRTEDNVDHPVSFYAASKKSNELMAHAYSHLFGLPTTGLRFFTVYGPWGRPDMAYFLFTDAILNNRPIKVFNHGDMSRDFTYIADIVEGIRRVIDAPPAGNAAWNPQAPDPSSSPAPYRVFNIGNSQPVALMDFIGAIEKALGREAKKQLLPMQPGDVECTYADTSALERELGYKPDTPLKEGIGAFVKWYRGYYHIA
ncbi:MAG: NAD-dependent epimerase [Lewinellaceae bacterium]|nr:NAD-dependent epimerase [Lewinellaceae bacterium]